MARWGRRAPRWLAPLLAALALAGCAPSDPTLEWTAFDGPACPDGSDGEQCFVLRAESSGTLEGQGPLRRRRGRRS